MDMNKLLLNGSTSALDKYIEEAEITVKGNSTLNSININNNFVLDILIEKDSTLTFNMFNYANDFDIVLNITCDDNAKFVFNNSFISNKSLTVFICFIFASLLFLIRRKVLFMWTEFSTFESNIF